MAVSMSMSMAISMAISKQSNYHFNNILINGIHISYDLSFNFPPLTSNFPNDPLVSESPFPLNFIAG